MIRNFAAVVFALSVAIATAGLASAACRVTGWTSGDNSHPVFVCD